MMTSELAVNYITRKLDTLPLHDVYQQPRVADTTSVFNLPPWKAATLRCDNAAVNGYRAAGFDASRSGCVLAPSTLTAAAFSRQDFSHLQRRWKQSQATAANDTSPCIYKVLPSIRNTAPPTKANCNNAVMATPVRFPDIRDGGVVKPMCRPDVLPNISSTNVRDDGEFDDTDDELEKAADTASSFSPPKCRLTSRPRAATPSFKCDATTPNAPQTLKTPLKANRSLPHKSNAANLTPASAPPCATPSSSTSHGFSPVFSAGLPTTSTQRCPTKRKRCAPDTAAMTPSYCLSPTSKSCDAEVMSAMCDAEIEHVTRTLSFDDALMSSRACAPGRLRKRLRNRPSLSVEKMTSSSSSMTSLGTSSLGKCRKVKVVKLKDQVTHAQLAPLACEGVPSRKLTPLRRTSGRHSFLPIRSAET